MMSSLDLLLIAVAFGAVAIAYARLPIPMKSGVVIATVLSVMLGIAAQPAVAAAANDNALSEGQKALHETLKTTPNGNQYQGIEYPQVKGEPLSDREISRRIKSEVPRNVKLSVSNGSVRLSGQVNNRDVAQRIVQDIKSIPGVHEVSYDLGLSSWFKRYLDHLWWAQTHKVGNFWKLPTVFCRLLNLSMTSPKPENENVKNAQNSSSDDQTVDVRDLVSKGGYQKNPREVVENPAVTPQIPDESSDSQIGMERGDREENA